MTMDMGPAGNNGRTASQRTSPDATASCEQPWQFKPGNPYAFRPGQSGNPRGRPRSIQREVREFLKERLPNDAKSRSILRALLEGLLKTAARGGSAGVAATRELLDRAYGRVPVR